MGACSIQHRPRKAPGWTSEGHTSFPTGRGPWAGSLGWGPCSHGTVRGSWKLDTDLKEGRRGRDVALRGRRQLRQKPRGEGVPLRGRGTQKSELERGLGPDRGSLSEAKRREGSQRAQGWNGQGAAVPGWARGQASLPPVRRAGQRARTKRGPRGGSKAFLRLRSLDLVLMH